MRFCTAVAPQLYLRGRFLLCTAIAWSAFPVNQRILPIHRRHAHTSEAWGFGDPPRQPQRNSRSAGDKAGNGNLTTEDILRLMKEEPTPQNQKKKKGSTKEGRTKRGRTKKAEQPKSSPAPDKAGNGNLTTEEILHLFNEPAPQKTEPAPRKTKQPTSSPARDEAGNGNLTTEDILRLMEEPAPQEKKRKRKRTKQSESSPVPDKAGNGNLTTEEILQLMKEPAPQKTAQKTQRAEQKTRQKTRQKTKQPISSSARDKAGNSNLTTEEVLRLMKEPAPQKTTPDITSNRAPSRGNIMEDPPKPQPQKSASSLGKRPPPRDKSLQKAKKEGRAEKKKARKRERDMTSGSADEILALDVQILIDSLNQDENSKGGGEEEGPAGGAAAAGGEWMDSGNESLPKEGSVIEVHVVELSSTGDGLALQEGSKRIYAVGFVVPGDTVKVKVFRHFQEEKYTIADFISVVNPSPLRDDERIRCKHFATCSGCQFQMLDYNDQLRLKKRIVERAFRNFSQLPPELVPAVQDTIGSPLQYGYRTKLTPHFDGPPNWRQGVPFKACPPIGFMRKGTRTTVDIEDCPIGTDVVRLGMRRERARMAAEYSNYIRGATLLLRETTKRIPKPGFENIIKAGIEDEPPLSPRSKRESAVAVARESPPDDTDLVIVDTNEYTDLKTCITDNNAISTEYVGPYVFHNPAGFFFQNNNSILPTFTDYVRQHIFPPPPSTPTTTSTKDPLSSPSSSPASPDSPIEFLIDAYSGSGLFTITLSSVLRGGSVGVDIAPASIAFGVRNARANGLAPGRARFVAADAHTLFTPELRAACPPDRSVVVVDPPRKGCDDAFLGQLLAFGPRRVVYVSCNVHTQARDVGVLVRGEQPRDADDDAAAAATGRPPVRYAIESLRGFDFFPQTGHVEGVAVLNRVDADEVP